MLGMEKLYLLAVLVFQSAILKVINHCFDFLDKYNDNFFEPLQIDKNNFTGL